MVCDATGEDGHSLVATQVHTTPMATISRHTKNVRNERHAERAAGAFAGITRLCGNDRDARNTVPVCHSRGSSELDLQELRCMKIKARYS
jgi:hypothetical protein